MSQRLPTNVGSIEELHSLLHNFEIECSKVKRKRTCLERFDAENALQNPEITAGDAKYL